MERLRHLQFCMLHGPSLVWSLGCNSRSELSGTLNEITPKRVCVKIRICTLLLVDRAGARRAIKMAEVMRRNISTCAAWICALKIWAGSWRARACSARGGSRQIGPEPFGSTKTQASGCRGEGRVCSGGRSSWTNRAIVHCLVSLDKKLHQRNCVSARRLSLSVGSC